MSRGDEINGKQSEYPQDSESHRAGMISFLLHPPTLTQDRAAGSPGSQGAVNCSTGSKPQSTVPTVSLGVEWVVVG